MTIELNPDAAKKVVITQSQDVALMINKVGSLLSSGNVKEAFNKMDYDLLGSFARNLEILNGGQPTQRY